MNSCGQNYAAILIFMSFFDRIQTNEISKEILSTEWVRITMFLAFGLLQIKIIINSSTLNMKI